MTERNESQSVDDKPKKRQDDDAKKKKQEQDAKRSTDAAIQSALIVVNTTNF